MAKTKIALAGLVSLAFGFPQPASADISMDVETGAVFSGYNDVQIPGDTGTRFSLSEDLDADPAFFYRLRVLYDFNPRHHISALYAPLTINSSGRLDRDLVFEGETFPANTPLDATYKFNSYRVTYRYDFFRNNHYELGVGFTAKIRDAKIEVKGNGLDSAKSNVGFVPIINFRFMWKVDERYAFLLEGDALAAPQGRAEDILAAFTVKTSERVTLRAGYRILEGGADNDTVYNFALIHYASFGAQIRF